MTTVEVLRKARALIDTPEKWAKGGNAFSSPPGDGQRPPHYSYIPATSSGAVSFCPSGAINRVVGGGVDDAALALVATAERAFSTAASVSWPHEFNDRTGTTHEEVLAAFDRAIASCESSEVPA